MKTQRLTDLKTVRTLLDEQGVHPRKQYGQNFLVDDRVVEEVRRRVADKAPEVILEIGPGLGALTEAVLDGPRTMVAVEVDPRLAQGLAKRMHGHPQVEVRMEDVLALNLTQEFAGQKILVLGSLPYRITSPILKHLIRHRSVISESCIITQWEVATKVAESPGKGGSSLGVLVRAYADVTPAIGISSRSFWPAPDVGSAYWEMTFLSSPRFTAPEALFFRVVRVLYGHRRKMIRRALQDAMGADEMRHVLQEAGIDGARRGETLSFEELDRLAKASAPWL